MANDPPQSGPRGPKVPSPGVAPARRPAPTQRPPPRLSAPPPVITPPAPSATPRIPSVAPVVPPAAPATSQQRAPVIPAIAPVVPPVAPTRAAPPAVPRVAPVVPAVAPVVPPSVPKVAPVVPAVAPVRPAANGLIGAAPANPRVAVAGVPPDLVLDLEARVSRLDELDYFEILKLPQGAPPAEIKQAFYRESRAYHPDRFFHVEDAALKAKVNDLYKRITEAYYVLRDDLKRKRYLADIQGPERARKLRFDEASEQESKLATKKEREEQIGTHPKGRHFYQNGMKAADAGRWADAERDLKMACTYEPSNARYKEKLTEVREKIRAETPKGDQFKIR